MQNFPNFSRTKQKRAHQVVKVESERPFASRMIQGIFAGHHDQTGAVLCSTKNGVVRAKS